MNRMKMSLAIGAFILAGGPALADSSIYVESGAGGEGYQDYDTAAQYYSATGLFLSNNGPTNGTTSTVSPLSAPAGLTAETLYTQVLGFNASTTSSASGDLSTGIVRGYAAGTGNQSDGTTDARLEDMVHFNVAGGGSAEITVMAHLDGTVMLSSDPFSLASIGYRLVLGGSLWYVSQTDPNSSTVSTDGPGNGYPPMGWDSYAFTDVTNGGFDFTGTFTAHDGDTDRFLEELSLTCESGASCDFSHTGDVALELPAGVTDTSDSGVFLSGAVPEPATWTMMFAGFAGVGWAVRRRSGVRKLSV